MGVSVREELVAWVERLPESNQRVLLEVLRGMVAADSLRRWSPSVGSLRDEDAEEMLRAIEDGCENIDAEAW